MSQIMNVNEEEVQYVLNDTEFVLDSSEINSEALSDIIYSDGTRAILVNGHGQIIQGEGQTVVLQNGEDLSQYYINDESGQILVADDQDASISHALEGAEIIQYVDEDENTTEEPQVIYVNEDGFAIQEPDLSEYQITEPQEGQSAFPLKAIKLETQVVDLEELMRQQGEGETAIIQNLNEENGYQYAILKDGKLHIQSYTGDVFPIATPEEVQEEEDDNQKETNQVDISKITGRNLLTGQTVTLHSYMDKLQKKIKNTGTGSRDTVEYGHKRKGKQQDALKSLLNKKLTLGKTASGKRLVGKVIYVEKKGGIEGSATDNMEEEVNIISEEASSHNMEDENVMDVEENSTESTNGCNDPLLEQQENNSDTACSEQQANGIITKQVAEKEDLEPRGAKRKIVIHEKIVSKECFGHISRTLSGLMNMDSVKKKLQYKDIIVKVVEKKYIHATKTYTKNVSYSSGYMHAEYTVADDGDTVENWYFMPDPNTKEAIFGKSADGDDDMDSNQESERYLEIANVTLMITQGKTNERVIRVILNPTNSNRCAVCAKEFRSHLQLRVHINNAHRTSNALKMCEICSENFDDHNKLQEHRKKHVDDGKLFQCSVSGCGKFFLTAGRLKRHSMVHNIALRPLECSVCLHRCSSESGLKRHLMTHMNIKPFTCETCGKRFSNPGDLNFHKRIHDLLKYYACEICKRTFSRHSNLQRHVEIHKGSGDLFWCTICGCSYHYMSSLTRHVVQNHIKRDGETTDTPVENETEGS